MPTLAAPLDYAKLEARNQRIHQLTTAPVAPVTGQLYYNTLDNTLYWWDNTVWQAAKGGGATEVWSGINAPSPIATYLMWIDTDAPDPVVTLPPATTGSLGVIQLAGDLTGTASAPLIAPGVIILADCNATLIDQAAAVASLRTLGTTAIQACAGNDSRLTDGRAPTGAAGGDLSGTYPNPQILAGAIILGDCNASMADQAAITASLRTIGTGALQACAGNDARLTDSRAPTGTAGGDLSGTYPNPQILAGAILLADCNATLIDQVAATASLRTLGTTGNKAMPGIQTLDIIPLAAADVSLNSKKIISLADPLSAQDAATKNYVDTMAQGLDVKASCRVASTVNLTVASPGATIDGVAMAATNRVLLKDQSTATENGIWVWSASGSPLTRATDADSAADVTPGMFTFIEEGTINADSGWVLSSGTWGAAMTFSQFSGAGQITAGAGLTKIGNTIDAVGTANRITVAADAIDIASTFDGSTAGGNTITKLGTVTAGVWNGTDIAVADGGTGQSTAKAGRETGLGAAGYYSSATHAAGTTISISAATHGLRGSMGLLVQCQIAATGAVILPDVVVDASGNVAVTFSVSQALDTIRVTIIG